MHFPFFYLVVAVLTGRGGVEEVSDEDVKERFWLEWGGVPREFIRAGRGNKGESTWAGRGSHKKGFWWEGWQEQSSWMRRGNWGKLSGRWGEVANN